MILLLCMKNAQSYKIKNVIEMTTVINQLISHGELVGPFKNFFKSWQIQFYPSLKSSEKKIHCLKLSGDLYEQGKCRNIVVQKCVGRKVIILVAGELDLLRALKSC